MAHGPYVLLKHKINFKKTCFEFTQRQTKDNKLFLVIKNTFYITLDIVDIKRWPRYGKIMKNSSVCPPERLLCIFFLPFLAKNDTKHPFFKPEKFTPMMTLNDLLEGK